MDFYGEGVSRYRHHVELTGPSSVLEAGLIPVTAELNATPLRVSRETWLKNWRDSEVSADYFIEAAQRIAGEPFRPNSPADVRYVLKLNSSTSKDDLSAVDDEREPLARAILSARSAITERSQLRKWRPYADYGSVQAVWDSCGTPHGRYTSEHPCLMNRIAAIRETIEPPPGCTFLSFDLNQAEYRVWASLSRDPFLIDAFECGTDFHYGMAKSIQSMVPAWHPSDLRAGGKTVNFAILYQIQPPTLARMLGCSVWVAELIIRAYYQRVPVAAAFIKETLAKAKQDGYVETAFGRRRYCPDFKDLTGKEEHELAKSLWNHVVAGTAAEITKWRQLRTWEGLRAAGFGVPVASLAIQAYDGVIWVVLDDYLDDVGCLAEELWSRETEEGFLLFKTTVRTGKTWEATK